MYPHTLDVERKRSVGAGMFQNNKCPICGMARNARSHDRAKCSKIMQAKKKAEKI